MDEEFEEWVRYVETFKNKDGKIDLSAHPDFFDKVLPGLAARTRGIFDEFPANSGLTINYELVNLKEPK